MEEILCINVGLKEAALILAVDIAREYRLLKEKIEKESIPTETRRMKNRRDIEEKLLIDEMFYKLLDLLSSKRKLKKYRKKGDQVTSVEISPNLEALGEYSKYIVKRYVFDWKNNMVLKNVV